MNLNDYVYIKDSPFCFANYIESWLHIKGFGKKITIDGSKTYSCKEQVGKLDICMNIIKCLSYALFPITCLALIYREVRRDTIHTYLNHTVKNQFAKTFNNQPKKISTDHKKQSVSSKSPQNKVKHSPIPSPVQALQKPLTITDPNKTPPPSPLPTFNDNPPSYLANHRQVQPIISAQPVLLQETQRSAPHWIILSGNEYTSNSDNTWAQCAKEILKQQLLGGKISEQMPTKPEENAVGIFILHLSERLDHDDTKIAIHYATLKELTGKNPIILIIDLNKSHEELDSKKISEELDSKKISEELDSKKISSVLGINIEHLFWVNGSSKLSYNAKGEFEFKRNIEQKQIKKIVDSIKAISSKT